MAMISWFGQLESAQSPSAIAAIVRDYLALWSPEEIALLPVAVRPGRVRDGADVSELNGRLVEAYRNTRATGDALAALQRLSGFFARAAVRIGQLGDDGTPEESREAPAERRVRTGD
jgi:hypothetical protein